MTSFTITLPSWEMSNSGPRTSTVLLPCRIPRPLPQLQQMKLRKLTEDVEGQTVRMGSIPRLKKAPTLSFGEKPCGGLLTLTTSTALPSAAHRSSRLQSDRLRSDKLQELAPVTAESWLTSMFFPSLPDRDGTSDLLHGNKTVSAFVLPFYFF